MSKRIQKDFFENDRVLSPSRLSHGGELAKGKRKLMRPLDPRRPVHLTLRSSKAKGALSLKSKRIEIEKLVWRTAQRERITIHAFANVGNHLHLFVSFKTREACQRFLRVVAGLVARLVTGARKGKPFGKFWDELVHSRVVTGRRAFLAVKEYIERNLVEATFGPRARNVVEGWFAKTQLEKRAIIASLE